MKKRMLFILLAIAFLLISNFGTIHAQDNETDYGKFGIGVSFLNLLNLLQAGGNISIASNIYFPISITEKFRLEPEIGFVAADNDIIYTLGFGIFGLKGSNHLLVSYGARIGIVGANDSDWSDGYFHISPAVGGEYFLSPRFSLGAEAQIKALFINNEVGIFTNTAAFLRFYFN